MPKNTFPAAALPRAHVPAAEAPRPEKLHGLAVGVVIIVGLYLGREVLIPITLAVLLSFLLTPLVGLLQRIRLPKVPAVLLSVMAALGVILMLGGVIGTQLASLAQDLPRYQNTIQHKVSSVRGYTTSRVDQLIARFGREVHNNSPINAAPASAVPGEQKPMTVVVQEPAPSPLHLLQQVLGPVLSPLETIGIVFIVAIFILLQREDLRDRLIRLFGSNDLLRTTAAINDGGSRLARYFLTQLGINASFGLLIGIGLSIIGVPSPILWGVLGALLRFVPYVGSLIAALLPVALAAAVDPGWSMMIWTAALFLVTEGVMGQAVEPLVYGHSTGLSPVAVIVVAIFWSWIWGPIGLILSTPLTLCLVVLGRHVEHLEFLDVLLGDRPALTPIESLYQRMLAGDEDEILRQAEGLLKTRSLSSYYDDVVLKGLQLAAADMQRGALPPERVKKIDTTIQDLVHDLEGYDDIDPAPGEEDEGVAGSRREDRQVPTTPPAEGTAPAQASRPKIWQTETPILCLAGRGLLDEAASVMLAQLLRKHNLEARVAPHQLASRTSIESLDPAGVAMVCLSYLELSGNPTSLRYLLRRLRQRLPGVPLLVGLWPDRDDFLNDKEMRQYVEADFYVGTLTDAVATCLKVSHQVAALSPFAEAVSDSRSSAEALQQEPAS